MQPQRSATNDHVSYATWETKWFQRLFDSTIGNLVIHGCADWSVAAWYTSQYDSNRRREHVRAQLCLPIQLFVRLLSLITTQYFVI